MATMTDSMQAILDASRALSIEERRALAEAIWDTISLEDDWRPSDAVLAEVHRRLEEHDRDPSTAVSWDEMQMRLQRLRQRLQ